MEWVITSSVLILTVIALRYILRGKISLRLQYSLWLLVLLRLLVPINFAESSVSVMNALPEDNRGLGIINEPLEYTPAESKTLSAGEELAGKNWITEWAAPDSHIC